MLPSNSSAEFVVAAKFVAQKFVALTNILYWLDWPKQTADLMVSLNNYGTYQIVAFLFIILLIVLVILVLWGTQRFRCSVWFDLTLLLPLECCRGYMYVRLSTILRLLVWSFIWLLSSISFCISDCTERWHGSALLQQVDNFWVCTLLIQWS